MNQKQQRRTGLAVFLPVVRVASANNGIVAGLKSAFVSASDDTTQQALFARVVAQYSLPNERLLAYAARSPPPQNWYDTDEDLF